MNYVIIGNSAAAVGAVEGIRKIDQTGKITLISDEPYRTYSRPLISYYLAGKVTEEKMLYRERDFYEKNKVTALLGEKAVAIDPERKTVQLANEKQIPYDKLLIATGGTPFIPPIEGLDKEGIYTFIKLDDVKKIKGVAQKGAKAVIVGAGLIGLKAAESLAKLGVEITIVELANRVLSAILDEEAGQIVQKHLTGQGIKLELNTTVQKIEGGSHVTGVTLKDGRQMNCDFVIIAIGVRPNTAVVENSPVKVNRGIVVDAYMQTNVPHIYAAGDVAEGYDLVYGQKRVLPILPNAYRQGETAGLNMAGHHVSYTGGFAMNAIEIFGLPMLTSGIIAPQGDSYEVLANIDPEKAAYRKIVLKDNIVSGFILLNKVDRAGILTGLISQQVNVETFKEDLLNDNFGYIHLPEELRKSRMLKGVEA